MLLKFTLLCKDMKISALYKIRLDKKDLFLHIRQKLV